jgi:hypothetical protein
VRWVRRVSAKFFELVGWRDEDAFIVESLRSTDVELVGDVVKKVDGSVYATFACRARTWERGL